MNIILTGMRGTGKSTIGQVLADMFEYTLVDTDVAIEKEAGCPIATMVARDGWEHFRSLERQIVASIAGQDKQVIATGGGTLIDEDNARLLKDGGVVVLLLCDVIILQRRIASETNRPSLTGQASAVDELDQVWQTRRSRYHAVADLTYDVSTESTDSMQDVQHKAAAIHALLQQANKFTLGVEI